MKKKHYTNPPKVALCASAPPPKRSASLREAHEAYFASMRAPLSRCKHLRRMKCALECLLVDLGKCPVQSISPEMIRDAWLKRDRPRSAQEFILGQIKDFFRWCRSNGYLPAYAPTAADSLFVAKAHPSQRLATSTVAELCALAPDAATRLNVALLCLTGLRLTELIHFPWEGIHLLPISE